MIDLRKVHERETFALAGEVPLSWSSIRPSVMKMGFTLIDDFIRLRRTDSPSAWESESLVTCDFLLRGEQVYPDESDFDCLQCSILVASLPEKHVSTAICAVHQLAAILSLKTTYSGHAVTCEESLSLMKNWLAEILEETGDVAGSDSVQILIAMEYGRN